MNAVEDLSSSPSRVQILNEFAKTINSNNVGLIEVAMAQPGGSKFNQALYFDQVTSNDIESLLQKEMNYTFLNGIQGGAGDLKLGVVVKRFSTDETVTQRNIISLDADLKDIIPGFKDQSAEQKKIIAETIFRQHHPQLKNKFCDLWMATFSGNGLHLHFKLKTPLTIEDGKKYSENYRYLLDYLEPEVFSCKVKFDRTCSNPARIMRLPLSVNLKEKDAPIQTEVFYLNEAADASLVLGNIWKSAEDHQNRITESKKIEQNFSASNEHKVNLRGALTFRKVLHYFNYDKPQTIQETGRGNEFICSSPWKTDRSPSCYMDEDKKVFNDFSSGKGGDIFNLIAELEGLDMKQDFPKVITLAEKITGIQSTRKVLNMAKPVLAVNNSTQQQQFRNKATSDDYFQFFEQQMPSAKRDILSGELMVKIEDNWQPAKGRLNILASHALDSGHLRRTHLEPHMERWAEAKKKELLVDIPEWDGVDRLHRIAQSLKFSNISTEHFEELLKDWGAKIFARLDNPKVQNRIMIFKGGQGMGKDFLVNYMLGGLERYIANLNISYNENDNMAMLADHLVLNISEFDRTARTEVSTLKDWITREDATFRRPYSKAHEHRMLRCSFIATINVDEILRDHTGNRRYLIFDLTGNDRTYNQGQETDIQVLAQFRHLFVTGFIPSPQANAEVAKYLESMTPDDPNTLILEDFDARIRNLKSSYPSKRGLFEFDDIREMLRDMCKIHNLQLKNLQTKLKTNNRSRRRASGQVYGLPMDVG